MQIQYIPSPTLQEPEFGTNVLLSLPLSSLAALHQAGRCWSMAAGQQLCLLPCLPARLLVCFPASLTVAARHYKGHASLMLTRTQSLKV